MDLKSMVTAHLASKRPAQPASTIHPGEMLHHALKMKDQATDAKGHLEAHEAIVEAVKACYAHNESGEHPHGGSGY